MFKSYGNYEIINEDLKNIKPEYILKDTNFTLKQGVLFCYTNQVEK